MEHNVYVYDMLLIQNLIWNTKIKRYVPGFTATIPFSKGIQETINWFEEDPSRQIVKQKTNDLMDKIISKYESAFCS